MHVHDAMTNVLVTAGPDHTLREAARMMTAHGVGAAVVIDEEQGGPGIITERTSSAPSAATRHRTRNGSASTSPPR